MDPQSVNPVLAEVILRNPGGPSLGDPRAPITSENVTQYYTPDAIQATAVQRLGSLGFDVVQRSPLGLTIQGSKPLFEHTFRTRLVWQGGPDAGPVGRGAAPDRPRTPASGDTTEPDRPASPATPAPPGPEMPQPDRERAAPGSWVAAHPLVLPPSLRDVVEQVVLPTPMGYYQ